MHSSQKVCSQNVVTECAKKSVQRGQKIVMPSIYCPGSSFPTRLSTLEAGDYSPP